MSDIHSEITKKVALGQNSLENQFYIEEKFELIKSAVEEMEEENYYSKNEAAFEEILELILNIINSVELYYQEADI